MEYLTREDVWCAEVPMPMSVHSFVCRKGGLIFLIVNADLSDEAKEEAIRHEFDHLEHEDLYSEEDAAVIERERDVHEAESVRELDVPVPSGRKNEDRYGPDEKTSGVRGSPDADGA